MGFIQNIATTNKRHLQRFSIPFLCDFLSYIFLYFCWPSYYSQEPTEGSFLEMRAESNQYSQARHISLSAEAFCAALLDNNVYFDDLIIEFAGSFRRTYRNDIESVTIEAREPGNDKITLVLNRDGIYDKLPEGLFHQSLGSSRTAALRDMIGEHRRYKEEEKAARKFFQPVQQEIFRFAVMAELEEREILFSMLTGNVSRTFFEFWDIDDRLPEKSAETLIRLMPLQQRIKSDKTLIAKSLQLCLDKKVDVTEITVYEQSCADAAFTVGNGNMLGVDTITGTDFSEPSKKWIFTIHDLTTSEMEQYLDGKPFGRFLARFTEIFLPIEIEAQFEFEPIEQEEQMQREYIMGYGFYI